MKIMDLINEIRHPMVSSQKVEHALYNFCQVLQQQLMPPPCDYHLVVGEPPAHDGRYEESNNDFWMNDNLALQEQAIDVILNVMQRRHYDAIVYEWSLSAVTLFSLGSSYRANVLVARGGIQRTLEAMEYFPLAERLHCVGMVALSHMVANATSPSLQQAIIYGNDSPRTRTSSSSSSSSSRDITAPPLFLFENLVHAMEQFPNSTHICKYASATFGAAYVQNGCQLRRRATSTDTAGLQTQQDRLDVIILLRALECVYHGLLMHSNGDEVDEATRVLRSFLRLFAGPDLAHKILHQVECQLCHGGAA
jgi:hypothetical protein